MRLQAGAARRLRLLTVLSDVIGGQQRGRPGHLPPPLESGELHQQLPRRGQLAPQLFASGPLPLPVYRRRSLQPSGLVGDRGRMPKASNGRNAPFSTPTARYPKEISARVLVATARA